MKRTQNLKFYDGLGLQAGAFFDQETFGTDKLVRLEKLLMQAPLSERARNEIVQIETAKIDYMPGVSSDAKKQRLSRMSSPDSAINQGHRAIMEPLDSEKGIGASGGKIYTCDSIPNGDLISVQQIEAK